MVDSHISLITRKLSSIEDITRIKPCRYNLKGFCEKKDRGKQEVTYSVEIDTKSAEQPASSVRFTQLFRYATPFELFLDATGVVGAMAAGAAQPLMTLVFGRLIQDFVMFTTALEIYQSTDSYSGSAAGSGGNLAWLGHCANSHNSL
ncbi:hypothetical protein PISMIDRAFT_17462 [Pisolithus microcarpus 441]|uniref:Unplaced genomic scaffold scaffold_266, whole genome shotgun sequence n=1 Tax=Pisolithus microcarpus 441 TaxID=765257 RepID=A0A0C9XP97_9AGAM|nr:hypothetical protein BKA83DRAFT_17462 [Pisolithus microcarpus]KIK14210.1 hypothetical protein PISMIDRAFT_17462 [Pisolithus microcarpus 441]